MLAKPASPSELQLERNEGLSRAIETVFRASAEALDEMMLYEWPGNVRELENAIERAVVVAKGRKIHPEHLPIFRPEHVLSSENHSLKEVERRHIVQILKGNQWNISRSAEILGIDRSTLYHKMKRHQIQKPT